MAGPRDFPYGGASDARGFNASLAERFRRHAESLARDGRSPLSTRLMLEAAEDLADDGVVADLFDGVPVPPGSVPQLRLLGALHYLVLRGEASGLARFYPSVGGKEDPSLVWPVARETMCENFAVIKQRLGRSVQTNEPGRAAALFLALLWLTDRYGLPIRLLELGASAGLNLLADRYRYVIGGNVLGDPDSPVSFHEPCVPPPEADLTAIARRLRIIERVGCDLAPLDPRSPEDRLTLLSYIWPDELERFRRAKAALAVSASAPCDVVAQPAGKWLPHALADVRATELTVVWHSLFRQYVDPAEWDQLQSAFRRAAEAAEAHTIVWLSMEPSDDHLANVELAIRLHPSEPSRHLAWCGDHGPPVIWLRDAERATVC